MVPSITIATMSLADVDRRWPWSEWVRRAALSLVYGFAFFWLFLLGGIGIIPPLVFADGVLKRLVWGGVGIPLGLLVWAVAGLAWTGAGSGRGFGEAIKIVVSAPLDWMLVAVEVMGIGGRCKGAQFDYCATRAGKFITKLPVPPYRRYFAGNCGLPVGCSDWNLNGISHLSFAS